MASPVVAERQSPVARRSGRTFAAVFGSILTAVGALAAAAAIGLISVFGTHSALDSATRSVSTAASAVVTDVGVIQNTRGIAPLTGWPTLEVTATGGNSSGVFIGIGPAADVEAYLAGTAYDRVTDLSIDPFALITDRRPGGATVPPPSSQRFWVAASDAPSAALNWQVRDGDYRLVIMNADGAPTLITQARVQLSLPNAFQISLLTLASGLVLLLAGVFVLVGALTRGRTGQHGGPRA